MSLSIAEATKFTLKFWEEYCAGSASEEELSNYFSRTAPVNWIGSGEGEVLSNLAELRQAAPYLLSGVPRKKKQIDCRGQSLSDRCVLVCGELCFERFTGQVGIQREQLRFTAICWEEQERISFRHMHVSVPDYLQIDSLTGLRNRVCTENKVNECLQLNNAFYGENQRALMMLDIDNFKEINDGFGHLFGDRVLREIAGKLRQVGEKAFGVTGRVGGDEFLLFFKNPIERSVVRFWAEEILRYIFGLKERADFGCRISVTIGIALAPQDGSRFETLLDKADQALYWGKNNGKNLYRFYDEIPESKKDGN